MKLILITGASGTGKTFLSNEISKYVPVTTIKTDDYYREGYIPKLRSLIDDCYYDKDYSIYYGKLIEDIYQVVNGNTNIKYNKYDFITKRSYKRKLKLKNNIEPKWLIIEGIFSFELIYKFNNYIDLKILLTASKDKCLERRIKRDVNERGRKINEIEKRFKKGWEIFHSKINKKINESNNILILENNQQLEIKKVLEKLT